MKYFVVSDLHGFFFEFNTALLNAGFDIENPEHKLIVCGDLMDRGQEAVLMQQYIMQLISKDKVILIRGNHEDLVLELLANYEKWIDYGIEYTHHFSNRTFDTLLQLTGCDYWTATTQTKAFARACYNTPFIKTIIPKMVDYVETEHYVFVHGWIPCNTTKKFEGDIHKFDPNWRTAAQSQWEEARWLNGMDCAVKDNVVLPNKTIICGHWHCSYGHEKYDANPTKGNYNPFRARGIIAIDACTALSRKVNCIVIEE